MAKIQQKAPKTTTLLLLFFSLWILLYAFLCPEKTGESIRESLSLFGRAILPSLFSFSVASKMLMRAGFSAYLMRTPVRYLATLLGLSGEGFSVLLAGLLAGFPMGASMLECSVREGRMEGGEAERLLPFANNAGAAFVVGTAGLSLFGAARVGRMLFLGATAASLLGVILFSRPRREPMKKAEKKIASSLAGVVTGAVSESAAAMLSVCGYVVFFALFSEIFLSVLAKIFPFLPLKEGWREGFGALFGGFLEISRGIFLLKTAPLQELSRLFLCGSMLGFGGISVLFQVADRVAMSEISLSFYLKGKCLTALLSAGMGTFFVFLSEKRGGGVWVFVIFVLIFAFGGIKNKIFFKKTMEKRKGMLYNRNEIHCP